MHLTAEILEFFYLADNENQKLFFPEWKIFVLKRFLFFFFLFSIFDALLFLLFIKKSFFSQFHWHLHLHLCHKTSQIISYLLSLLRAPCIPKPEIQTSWSTGIRSSIPFFVFRGIEFYFDVSRLTRHRILFWRRKRKTFLLFDSSFLFCVYKNGFFSLHYQKKARWKQR
jgi:hypothetical protein